MKIRRAISAMAIFLALSTVAASASEGTFNSSEDEAVTRELAKRSAMPIPELETLLATCNTDNATQLALNFCAWRNQVVAERELARTVAKKKRQIPQCKTMIDAKVNSWRHGIEEACKKAAASDYAGGSMEPLAYAMCVEAEIKKMTKQVKQTKNWGCRNQKNS